MRLKFGDGERAWQDFQKAFDILVNLQAQNALGDFDRPMLDDLQTAIEKLR